MSGPSAPEVRCAVTGGVATVTLARPDRLNAMNAALIQGLRSTLLSLGDRSDVRAIVLTGDGSAFCAGVDLAEGISGPAVADPVESALSWMRTATDAIWAMRAIPQPVVGAVHGWAVGAGLALATACDVRFIGSGTRFSAPFLGLGVSVGDLGLSWFLPRIIGAGRAAHLLFEAGVLDAPTAVDYGLAAGVSDDPLTDAVHYAERLASFPAYGVQASKQLLNASASAGLREHLDAEARAQVVGNGTAAAQRAFAAALGRMRSGEG